MKPTLSSTLALSACVLAVAAAEPRAGAPLPVTATFYISNVQCSTCADTILESIMKIRNVTKVDGLTGDSGLAVITFDANTASHHQIAAAITAANPVHGNVYEPSIRIKIPDYAKAGNAAKVDAIFAQSKDTVNVVTKDKAKGEFEIQFQPLKVDKSKPGPQGWVASRFVQALKEPAPKGLGLAVEFLK